MSHRFRFETSTPQHLGFIAGTALLAAAILYTPHSLASPVPEGHPVKCDGSVRYRTNRTPSDLACENLFTGERFTEVPLGKVLFVTDVRLKPNVGSRIDPGYVSVNLLKREGGGFLDALSFVTHSFATYSDHFTSPILVLSASQRLAAWANPNSEGATWIEVFGILAEEADLPNGF